MGATPLAIPIIIGMDMATVAATPHPNPRQRRAAETSDVDDECASEEAVACVLGVASD
jgi:hypothetical protein